MVLLIMVLSPEGLVGIIERGVGAGRRETPTEHSIELPDDTAPPVQPGSGRAREPTQRSARHPQRRDRRAADNGKEPPNDQAIPLSRGG
jgi:hypothetical protein